MTESMGPGKLVRHMQNPSYTYDEYLICIGLGPSISSFICKKTSYSGPSYQSSPVSLKNLIALKGNLAPIFTCPSESVPILFNNIHHSYWVYFGLSAPKHDELIRLQYIPGVSYLLKIAYKLLICSCRVGLMWPYPDVS